MDPRPQNKHDNKSSKMTREDEMSTSDFTPRAAAAWVAQEFAKVNAENAVSRYRSEQVMVEYAKHRADKFPNSKRAHEALLALIGFQFADEIAAADEAQP